MTLLWTKANTPASKFIKLILGEDCTHFSFVFQNGNRSGTMYESNFIGTHPTFLRTALKTHEIVHRLDIPLNNDDEDKIWDLVQDRYDGRPYDWLGGIYLAWHKLISRLFGVQMPSVNKWSQPGQYYCDEIYSILSFLPNFPKIDAKGGMHTPHDIYLILKAKLP